LLKRKKKTKGQSVVEYMAMTVFILAAFIIIQKYVARGLTGRWKATGDSFGQGSLYDQTSIECAFFPVTNSWYNVDCYEAHCIDGKCFGFLASDSRCRSCLQVNGCFIAECN